MQTCEEDLEKLLLMFLIGFGICMVVAPLIIFLMRRLKAGQNILHYVESHSNKQGTPTMGGFIFLFGIVVGYFIISGEKFLTFLALIITLCYALLGFLDDFLKIKLKHNEGLKAYQKFVGQFGIALIIAIFVYTSGLVGSTIIMPFSLKVIDIGWWIIPFVIFVYLAITNAVNLTDGLDGLAGKTSIVYILCFSLFVFITIEKMTLSTVILTEYSNLLLFACLFAGGILAFVCFNSHPAKIFMGDTGSLAIGGFVATLACFTRFYFLMPIIGIVFVSSVISVILQVGYYKMTKKRIFKMAPLHHHFEKCGVKETKIVTVYSVVTLIVGLLVIVFAF